VSPGEIRSDKGGNGGRSYETALGWWRGGGGFF